MNKQDNLEEEEKIRYFKIMAIKIYYKAMIIKTAWHQCGIRNSLTSIREIDK